MRETLIDHPKLRLERRTGTEGPQHDPYGFEEFCVTTPDGKAILHEGLGTWLELDGTKVEKPECISYEDFERVCRLLFEVAVGYTIPQIERINRKRHERCPHCGCKSFTAEAGFPGETLIVCDGCKHITGSHFNESAII